METGNQCFIISKMFAGSYLQENDSRNIGHEVLNFYSSDNTPYQPSSNYIYIYKGENSLPSRKEDIEAVILTKQYRKGCQEVLGIVTVDDVIKIRFHDKNVAHSGIKYCGHDIEDIFSSNYSAKGEKETEHNIAYIKTKAFYWPRRRILLADQTSEYAKDYEDDKVLIKILPDYQFSHQSPKNFVEKNQKPNAFTSISKIFKDDRYFIKKVPKTITLKDIENHESSECYLRAMDKLYSENIFSNLFRYFLNTDRELLKDFCHNLLKTDIDAETATIKREYQLGEQGRIDIFIEDEKHIIAIENKIKSGLNGKKGEQLKKYKKYIDKQYKNKKRDYYLFMPNEGYSPELDAHLAPDGKIDGFTRKWYDEIRTFFGKKHINLADENDKFNQKINNYYSDFLLALGLHCGDKTLSAEKAMEQLLFKRLRELEKHSHNNIK